MVLGILVHSTVRRFQLKRLAQLNGIGPYRHGWIEPLTAAAWRAAQPGAAVAEVADSPGGFFDCGSSPLGVSPPLSRSPGGLAVKRARSELDEAADAIAALPRQRAARLLRCLAAEARKHLAVFQRASSVRPAARGLVPPPGAREDNGLGRLKAFYERKGRKGKFSWQLSRKKAPGGKLAVGKGVAALPHPRGIAKRKPAVKRVLWRGRAGGPKEAAARASAIAAAAAVARLPAALAERNAARAAHEGAAEDPNE
jgi:hypothetical protein